MTTTNWEVSTPQISAPVLPEPIHQESLEASFRLRSAVGICFLNFTLGGVFGPVDPPPPELRRGAGLCVAVSAGNTGWSTLRKLNSVLHTDRKVLTAHDRATDSDGGRVQQCRTELIEGVTSA